MTDSLRLFFALPCPRLLAEQLTQWRTAARLPGRAVPMENLHLTLAFLGTQPADRLDTLREVAEGLRRAPLALALERLHVTRHGLLWIEPSQPPTALLQLADQLRERLAAVAIPFDGQTFRGHVTLIREGAELPQVRPSPFLWHADRFGLYHSQSVPGGVRYQAIQEWPLQD